MSLALSRGAIALAAASAVCFATGCGSSAEPSAQTARIDLVIGTQVVKVNADGTVTGAPIVISRVYTQSSGGTDSLVTDSVALDARFRKADGTTDPAITPEGYELEIEPSSQLIAYHRVSAFGGYLVGRGIGSASVNLCLKRLTDEQCVFVPQQDVSVTVNRVDQ